MIILLEGPDNGGKTTIVEELKRRHTAGQLVPEGIKLDFQKMTFREGDKVQRIDMLLERAKEFDVNIWERCYYPSDLVYNPLVEGKPSPVEEHRNLIEFKLLMANTLIVFVSAELNILEARQAARGDEYIKDNQLPAICASYMEVLRTAAVPWFILNTGTKTLDQCIDNLSLYVEAFIHDDDRRLDK